MKIFEAVMRFFFPPKCISCEKSLLHSAPIPYCNKCYAVLNDGKIFALTEKSVPNIDAIYAFYRYNNESAKFSVFHIKKCFSTPFADFYKELCRQMLDETNVLLNIDMITFVKRRSSEKRREGFDQAKMLAKIMSEVSGVPLVSTLKRVGQSKKQRMLTPEQRRKNVQNAFKATLDLSGKRIMLMDDVVTTGSTVSDCARALKESGAKEVRVLSFSI